MGRKITEKLHDRNSASDTRNSGLPRVSIAVIIFLLSSWYTRDVRDDIVGFVRIQRGWAETCRRHGIPWTTSHWLITPSGAVSCRYMQHAQTHSHANRTGSRALPYHPLQRLSMCTCRDVHSAPIERQQINNGSARNIDHFTINIVIWWGIDRSANQFATLGLSRPYSCTTAIFRYTSFNIVPLGCWKSLVP